MQKSDIAISIIYDILYLENEREVLNMRTKKYIGEKEYEYLTGLIKTYAHIVEMSDDSPLVKETFKGAKHAISNIVDMLDFTLIDYLPLEQIIRLGDIYLNNYRCVKKAPSRAYWKGAYDEIVDLIKYFFVEINFLFD